MIRSFLYPVVTVLISCTSCAGDYLDVKPSSDIDDLATLDDYQKLLDNSYVLGRNGSLPQISCDDYYVINDEHYNALRSETDRNAYIWHRDIYGGDVDIKDWNDLFQGIFYANAVLDGLNTTAQEKDTPKWRNLYGSALFFRAYAYFDLARNFCEFYNPERTEHSLGLPLRRTAAIDEILKRSTLGDTYRFIFSDLQQAAALLRGTTFPINNRNRPSLEAVHALLARIHLSIGDYQKAGVYADSCLMGYGILADFNDVSRESLTPFSYNAVETIFYANFVIAYQLPLVGQRAYMALDTTLINQYQQGDLRKDVYFLRNNLGNYNIKRGFIGGGSYQFTGLSTGEMYLIRAECNARNEKIDDAAGDMATLLTSRYEKGTSIAVPTDSAEELLGFIISERRKELVWRGLRWSDLKRYNDAGGNITLTRKIGENTFELKANDPRYVFPIPTDEILIGNLEQNPR